MAERAPLDPCAAGGAACFRAAEHTAEADPRAGRAALDRCLACSDCPPAAYRLQATLAEDAREPERGRDTLRQGTARFPESPALWLALGRAELALGRKSEGLAALGAAHRLQPTDAELEQEYNAALAQHGSEADRAEAQIHALLLEAAGRAEIDDLKGAEEALALAARELSRGPRLAGLVHHRRALLWMRRGRSKEAQGELDRALTLEPGPTALRAEMLIASSENLLGLKRVADAARAAEEATRVEPRNVFAHTNLGIARALGNDKDGALSALKQALDLGLPRKMSRAQFLGLGAIERLKGHKDFAPMVRTAWPDSPYP